MAPLSGLYLFKDSCQLEMTLGDFQPTYGESPLTKIPDKVGSQEKRIHGVTNERIPIKLLRFR